MEKRDRSVLFISQGCKEAVVSILSIFALTLLNLCRHCQALSARSFDPGMILALFFFFLQRKSSGVMV